MTYRWLAASALVVILSVVLVRAKAMVSGSVVHRPTTQPAKVSPLDFKATSIDGKRIDLSQYRGKVVLIVNVASRCGFTPQYKGLEKLYTEKQSDGLVILGFPANNFNHQEPGTDQQIKTFCSIKYDVTFPMMSKISVSGNDQAPLYEFLTSKKTNGDFGGAIGWNFTKFLVDRNGNVIGRFNSAIKPSNPKLVKAVAAALKAPAA